MHTSNTAVALDPIFKDLHLQSKIYIALGGILHCYVNALNGQYFTVYTILWQLEKGEGNVGRSGDCVGY